MKIHSVIKKGEDHPVFCEDFLSMGDTGRYFIGGVFDGCSGGNESHFASSLFGKIFRQIITDRAFSGNSMEEMGKTFMVSFVKKLFEVKISISLEDNDMLATFMLIIYDKVHGEALTMTVGDGVIHCDGETTIIENERFKETHPKQYKDMPDYIAYDLIELGLNKNRFSEWYDSHVIVKKFEDPQDISISTDGVLTFKTPQEEVNILEFLFEDDKWMNNKIMLAKKVNVLRMKYKSVHRDDVSIIRLIIKEPEDDKSNDQ